MADTALLMARARERWDDVPAAAALLQRALELDPGCLEAYVWLYKLYFYNRRLDEADHYARLALATAAALGRFGYDWRKARPWTTDWNLDQGPQRGYLYTLKALAFIRLRQADLEEGEAVLDKLGELDPEDRVGACVVRQLAQRLREDRDAA